MTRLTKRRLHAIVEALTARLAGEIENDLKIEIEDYERALQWAQEQLEQREPE